MVNSNLILMFSMASGVVFALIYIAAMPERQADEVNLSTILVYAVIGGLLAGVILYPFQYYCLRKSQFGIVAALNLVLISSATWAVTTCHGSKWGLATPFIGVFTIDIVVMIFDRIRMRGQHGRN